ncbi:MAG: hypothetical protein ACKOGA_05745 [Planctomycetaceae bacterium]
MSERFPGVVPGGGRREWLQRACERTPNAGDEVWAVVTGMDDNLGRGQRAILRATAVEWHTR